MTDNSSSSAAMGESRLTKHGRQQADKNVWSSILLLPSDTGDAVHYIICACRCLHVIVVDHDCGLSQMSVLYRPFRGDMMKVCYLEVLHT